MKTENNTSRFSAPFVKNSGVRDLTAAGTQIEAFGNIIKSYLLRAHPPARLEAGEAAALLGFHADDMPLLVRERLIAPLGNPSHNKRKYFALHEVEALGRDPERLAAATNAIYARNEEKAHDSCSQAVTIRSVRQNILIRIE